MGDAAREEEAGGRGRIPPQFRGRPAGEQFAARGAGAGAEVDDAVGVRHDLLVVLDDEQGVALGAQRLGGRDQPLGVAGVEADARLVEDVEDAGEVGAQLGGKPDALGLAPRQGDRGPVEREVVEADPAEEFQPFLDLGHDVPGDEAAAGIERQHPEGAQQFGGRPGAAAPAATARGMLSAEGEQLHGPGDAIEPRSAAGGADRRPLIFFNSLGFSLGLPGAFPGVFLVGGQIGDFGRQLFVVVRVEQRIEEPPVAPALGAFQPHLGN